LSRNYNKKVILFQAGSSGNFLAAFLTVGNIFVLPNNRIDLGQKVSSAIFVSGESSHDKRFIDFDSDICLANIKTAIVNSPQQVILSHYQKISKLREFESTNWIKKVAPTNNIFGWIKNIMYKKQYVEKIDFRQTAMTQQVDACFVNLQNWYEINRVDIDCPSDMIIDFDKINDITYLVDLYKSANGNHPDDMRIKFAEEYISKQFSPINDCDKMSIIDIVEHVDPKDAFDIATALFIYEKNHNTIDSNRLWTIDDLPNTVPECIEFLIANEKNYSF